MNHKLLHSPVPVPVPVTVPLALGEEVPFEAETWIPLFLAALAAEAADALQLLDTMERSWFTARAAPPPSISWLPRRWCPQPRLRPGWA